MTTAVVSFGTRVGILWGDGDALPTTGSAGFHFTSIDAAANPAVAASWTLDPPLPIVLKPDPYGGNDTTVNVKAAADGTVYAATYSEPTGSLVLRRTLDGSWTTHLVMEPADALYNGAADRLSQLALDEDLGVAYAFSSSRWGGAVVKSAPLRGPEALVFQGPSAAPFPQSGTPYIGADGD